MLGEARYYGTGLFFYLNSVVLLDDLYVILAIQNMRGVQVVFLLWLVLLPFECLLA